MKKRFLAGVLALTMLCGLSFKVQAEESEDNSVSDNNIEIDQSNSDVNKDQDLVQDSKDEESESVQADEETGEKVQQSENETVTGLSYRVHVQTYGWQDMKHDGETAGTTGQAKRLEALELSLQDAPYDGGIEYRTHVQTYGWQDWVSDGAVSGTSGQSKRLEAIQIRLTGEMANHYDVYYRVHAQTYGWLGWAKNGERAGTASYSKRLEGIEIVLVEKGAQGPDTSGQAYYAPLVQYQTHVQTYGWQAVRADGATSGTVGQAKRLEAIEINLFDSEALGYEGGIEYRTHVQTYGWQDWVSNGALSGTEGEAKRLEAVEIRLTGELADHYDVYYRVHSQTLGWLGWAKDGEPSGTEGFAKRLEGIEICLVDKNSNNAPDVSGQAYVSPLSDDCVQLFGRLIAGNEGERELTVNGNDQTIGLSDDTTLLEGFGMRFLENNIGGSVRYQAQCQNDGWKEWISEGGVAGTTDENKHLEAIKMELQGTVSQLYDIYYRTRVESYGWLGWSKNGEPAGTNGYSKGIEAIQVRLVKKGQEGPKIYELPFLSKSGAAVLGNPCPSAWISDEFGPRIAPTSGASTYHKGRDYAAPYGAGIYAAASGKIAKVDWNYFRGNYVIVDHGHGLSTVYQHCSRINVKQGDSVFVGAKIAEVGTTGVSTGPHLHFEVWVEGTPVDPRKYLK